MIIPITAEELATRKIEEYVDSCDCVTNDDVGNVLMKLLSTVGQALLATQGQEKAVAMVEGTPRHIAKAEFSQSWQKNTVQ